MLWDSSSQCRSPMCGVPGVGSASFPSLLLQCPSFPQTVSWVRLVPGCTSTLLPFFHMTSSLWLALESLFCWSLGHFLSYLHWCECYLGILWGKVSLGSSYFTSFPEVCCSINKNVLHSSSRSRSLPPHSLITFKTTFYFLNTFHPYIPNPSATLLPEVTSKMLLRDLSLL